MTVLRIAGVLATTLSLALSGCVVEHDVLLDLAAGPGGTPAGFYCRAPTAMGGGPYLLEQTGPLAPPCTSTCESGVCRSAAFVFDFVETDGIPSCRAGSIASYCETSRCEVTVRRCFDVDVCVTSDVRRTVEVADEAIRAASDGVILAEAPDGPVMVRMVGAAQRCDEVERDGLDVRAIFGCAYSCPAQLDSVEGTVLLDLDAFDDECGQSALACALFLTGQTPVTSR